MKTITQYQTCKEPSTKLLLELALSIVWFSRRLENYMCPNLIPFGLLCMIFCCVRCAYSIQQQQHNTHQWMILFSTNTIAIVRILCFVRCSVGGAWRMEPTHRQNTHSTSEIFLEAYSTVRLSTAVCCSLSVLGKQVTCVAHLCIEREILGHGF